MPYVLLKLNRVLGPESASLYLALLIFNAAVFLIEISLH